MLLILDFAEQIVALLVHLSIFAAVCRAVVVVHFVVVDVVAIVEGRLISTIIKFRLFVSELIKRDLPAGDFG